MSRCLPPTYQLFDFVGDPSVAMHHAGSTRKKQVRVMRLYKDGDGNDDLGLVPVDLFSGASLGLLLRGNGIRGDSIG